MSRADDRQPARRARASDDRAATLQAGWSPWRRLARAAPPALLGLLLLLGSAPGCGQAPSAEPPVPAAPAPPRMLRFGGASMGTTFSIQAHGLPAGLDQPRLARDAARLLDDLDAALSTWRDDSRLARFNALDHTDWFAVCADTATIVRRAQELASWTDGALDVTVGPLVELWGFGPSGRRADLPDAAEIAATRARTGWRNLHLRSDPPALRKDRPDLALDLSALAKGHAIDRLGAQLDGLGVQHWLIEFGGELRGRGHALDGTPWRVGIASPDGTAQQPIVLELGDAAIATSGDAHNALVIDGQRHAHVIDPRSGRPTSHALASVSVLADTALEADALATALYVLGPREGLELAEQRGLAALFLVREEGRVVPRRSEALERWTPSGPAPTPDRSLEPVPAARSKP